MISCTASEKKRLNESSIAIQSEKTVEEIKQQAYENEKRAAQIPPQPKSCSFRERPDIPMDQELYETVGILYAALERANTRIKNCYYYNEKIRKDRIKQYATSPTSG